MKYQFIEDAIRPSLPVDDEPCVTLVDWRVPRLVDGSEILVGIRLGIGTRRISTPVVEFVPLERMAITSSGRRYFLDGLPAYLKAEAAALETSSASRRSPAIDVSDRYWAAILDAVAGHLK